MILRTRKSLGVLLLVGAACLVSATSAEETKGANVPPPPSQSQLRITAVAPVKAQLGGEIAFHVEGLSKEIGKDSFDPSKYTLFVNGQRLPSASGRLAADKTTLVFRLRRGGTAEEIDIWNRLLGGSLAAERPLTLNIGIDQKSQLELGGQLVQPVVTLQVFSPRALASAGIGLVLTLIAFWLLAIKSDVIRDSAPPSPAGNGRRPYSLAKFQMAVWFFVVLASFLFIYMITGETGSISDQALALIGIGSGTALGAAAIDANKRSSLDATLGTAAAQEASVAAELEEAKVQIAALPNPPVTPADQDRVRELRKAIALKTVEQQELVKQRQAFQAQQAKPTSESFIMDILTDANGVSFHRFQMLAWTVVLVAIFLNGVFLNLTMPVLNTTQLALMGISAGTYLGFKIPEKQA